MEAVVEFQSFKDNDNRYVIKELAIVSKHFRCQLIFAPPYSKTFLDEKQRRNANWLAKHYHHIDWSESGLPYDENLLKSLCQPFGIIYTKGYDKVNFLSQFHPCVKDIIDSADLTADGNRCLLHRHNSNFVNCAMRNAERHFKTILSTRQSNDYV